MPLGYSVIATIVIQRWAKKKRGRQREAQDRHGYRKVKERNEDGPTMHLTQGMTKHADISVDCMPRHSGRNPLIRAKFTHTPSMV